MPFVPLLRWLRWKHWVDSKLAFAGGVCYYLALTNHWSLGQTLATFGRFFPFLCCLAAFGYACNNYFDNAADLAGGKDPPLAVPDPRVQRRIVLGCLGATVLAFIPFMNRGACVSVGVGGILLATAYSAPPLRLKVRGAVGLLSAAIAQWTLPALLIVTGTADLAPGIALMLVLSLSIGARWVLIHQISDAPADARAGTPTFTRDRGIPAASRLLWSLIAFEVALLLVWPFMAGEAARPIALSTAAYL
ncbi:MAG TPA: hypothetical protein VL691_05380, partial [Vicinamibacteria bacterium]|nr:hypothetical protein [Vicinamibacteria bacterium]